MFRSQVVRGIAGVLLILSAARAEEAPLKLLKQLSLTPKEITRMLQREIVSKKLDTSDKRDIAVLGAMLLDVPTESTVEAVRDIKTFKHGKEILGLEKFEKYDIDEIKDLKLDDQELDALGACRIRECESKMPGAWIEKLRAEKDNKQRLLVLRALLADYAKEYAALGGKAVLDYEGTKRPVPAQKEFENVLENSNYLKTLSPEFHQYLKTFPENPPAGIENYIYWSREKFGFKPVINLTHVSIYPWSDNNMRGYLIASRQVYADHYSDASLGLTILIERPRKEGEPPGSYLIYINRSRIDMLGGFLSSLRRAITLPRIRSGLEVHMKSMRTRVEDKPEAKPPTQ